jgi:hypothetical protein
MTDDRITIEELQSTVLPSLDHLMPAMREGLTVKLTVRQIRALMSGGTDAALALADLSNTTGPRGPNGRLVPGGTDCNDLLENGYWIGGDFINAPDSGAFSIRVEYYNAAYLTQFARAVGGDGPTDSLYYKRELNGGIWSAWYRVRETEAEIVTLAAIVAVDEITTRVINDPWAVQPIGTIVPLLTNLTGITEPPTNKTYRYAKLSAGYTGAGQYNNGVLTSESVSGSWPTVLATATISLAGSPFNGQTIRLINAEGRFLRAGDASGTLQDSQNQAHSHVVTDPGHAHNLATYVWNVPATVAWSAGATHAAQAASATQSASTGISLQSSGGDETRPRNMSVAYYMRVK